MIEVIIQGILTIIGSGIVAFVIVKYFTGKYSGLEQLSEVAVAIFDDWNEDSKFELKEVLASANQLGIAAQSINGILQDKELFDDLLTDFAGRIRKSFVGAMMGTASGDSRKAAKAEQIVNEAMIQGVKKLNPIIGWLMKETGLDVTLEENPDLLPYLLVEAEKRGLFNLFNNESLALPSKQPTGEPKQIGVEF